MQESATAVKAAKPPRFLYRLVVVALAAFVIGIVVQSLATVSRPISESSRHDAPVASKIDRQIETPGPSQLAGRRYQLAVIGVLSLLFGIIGARPRSAVPTTESSTDVGLTVEEVETTTELPILANLFPAAALEPQRASRKSNSRYRLVNAAELVLAAAVVLSVQAAIAKPNVRQLFRRDPFGAFQLVVCDLAGHVHSVARIDGRR